MNINKTNYESWFLDYFEGTLSTMKVAELFLFLHQHPELQPEFDAFQPLHLPPPEILTLESNLSLFSSMITL